MSIFIDQVFTCIALSHLVIDIIAGQRSVLLTYWCTTLGLTNTDVGLVSTVYILLASLSQPFFGYLADRRGSRWPVACGLFWVGLFYFLALLIPGKMALIFLILASLGSGAFHPAGSMQVAVQGQTHLAGKVTTAASFFFLFGQLGGFFGPLFSGPLLQKYGEAGLFPVPIACLLISILASYQLRNVNAPRNENSSSGKPVIHLDKTLILLMIAACFQQWAQQNITTFVPKYLSDLGADPTVYGAMTAVFMGGAALGNVLGGILSDRIGRVRVMTFSLCFSSIPLALIGSVGSSSWLYPIIIIAGMFSGAAYSALVVQAQQHVPGGMALVTGLILGLMFSSGSLGTLVSGVIADHQGFGPVFLLSAALCLVGGLLASRLSSRKIMQR
jgi:FSR family fosmidomycin resistance protein-like MFS transporter